MRRSRIVSAAAMALLLAVLLVSPVLAQYGDQPQASPPKLTVFAD